MCCAKPMVASPTAAWAPRRMKHPGIPGARKNMENSLGFGKIVDFFCGVVMLPHLCEFTIG